jgi:NADH:ubiquinone oxidoreductase subunit 3 (subunit A)
MVSDWAFIGIFLALAFLLPVVPILGGMLLGPRKPGKIKSETYECGIQTRGESRIQFRASYFLYALVFLIFDVEAVLLFPWAVAYGAFPLYAALEGVVFILILATGLGYAWRKGALRWQ